jgi:hypothetical protein
MRPLHLRALLLFLLLPVLFAVSPFAFAGPTAAQPYIGEWSNGRGDPLIITATTIQFAHDKPVAYRDVTRASDGHSFTLQLVAKGKLNYLSPFMRLTVTSKEQMSTEGADSFNGDATSSATWFRDK